jgi:hypothetical protein
MIDRVTSYRLLEYIRSAATVLRLVTKPYYYYYLIRPLDVKN